MNFPAPGPPLLYPSLCYSLTNRSKIEAKFQYHPLATISSSPKMSDHKPPSSPPFPQALSPEWLPELVPNSLNPTSEVARPSSPKVYIDMDDGFPKFPITQRTIVCGDGEISTLAVECTNVISKYEYKTDAKTAVFEVVYQGKACIAKCWTPECVFE